MNGSLVHNPKLALESHEFNAGGFNLLRCAFGDCVITMPRNKRPTVMDAVKTLWDLRRAQAGESMVAEYEEVWKRDDTAWRNADPAARLALIAGTLHYKRRVVSHFYAYLAHLVDLKILPQEVFYKSWSKKDLEIIPQVLVPLGRAVGKALEGGDPAVLPALQRLYDNAPQVRLVANK